MNNSGWIIPDDRTSEMSAVHNDVMSRCGTFADRGVYVSDIPDRIIYAEQEIKHRGKLLHRIHQQTGSCLKGEALVTMGDGSTKPIEQIQAGDVVVTHEGRSRKVKGVESKTTDEKMMRFVIRGWHKPLECTEGHVVLVEGKGWIRADEIEVGDRVFCGAGSVEHRSRTIKTLQHVVGVDVDEVVAKGPVATVAGVSRPRALHMALMDYAGNSLVHVPGARYQSMLPKTIKPSFKFGRLIGLYAAEGSCDDHRVVWTINREHEALADEIIDAIETVFGVGVTARKCFQPSRPTVISVRLSGVGFVQLFKSLVPGTAISKRLHADLINNSPELARGILSGWFDGDGHAREHARSYDIVSATSSKPLAEQLSTMFVKVGVLVSVKRVGPYKKSKPCYRFRFNANSFIEAFSGDSFRLGQLNPNRETKPAELSRVGQMKQVEVISSYDYDEPVWDIEVEEDQSFVADGFIVHNCVGAGCGRAVSHSALGDCVARGESEEVQVQCWLPTYGVGRQIAGMRGRGEGSFGAAQAKAVEQFGLVHLNFEGMPEPTIRSGWMSYSASTEYMFSHPNAWRGFDKNAVRDHAQKHNVQHVTRIGSLDELDQCLAQFFGVTVACQFGTRRPQVRDGYLVAEWNASWAHQQNISGRVVHPSLGVLYLIDNQWGPNAHGRCPELSKIGVFGSYWIRSATMEKILRSRGAEVFGMSNTNGFDQRKIDWNIDWGTLGL